MSKKNELLGKFIHTYVVSHVDFEPFEEGYFYYSLNVAKALRQSKANGWLAAYHLNEALWHMDNRDPNHHILMAAEHMEAGPDYYSLPKRLKMFDAKGKKAGKNPSNAWTHLGQALISAANEPEIAFICAVHISSDQNVIFKDLHYDSDVNKIEALEQLPHDLDFRVYAASHLMAPRTLHERLEQYFESSAQRNRVGRYLLR